MRYPEHLKKNGTLGFVAPSCGCGTEDYRKVFDNALKNFKNLGHTIQLGPNCYATEGIGISNTPEKCGKELTEGYCSSENDALISCGGGELMCETIDYVDFEKIKAATPKWFMGFSDNTNFTFLLTTLCDVASIYGPCAPKFGMEPWHPSVQDAYDLLMGKNTTVRSYDGWEKESLKSLEQPLLPFNITEENIMRLYGTEEKEVSMEGILLGGCIDCLIGLIGTKYDKVAAFDEKYKEEGIVWFLEACDLNVMSIRRAFWHMEHAGWFHHVKGFIIGRPCCYGEEFMGLNQYEAVMGVLEKYHVPVIMDADVGHMSPMMPLICGAKAKVKFKDNVLEINQQEK